MIETSKDIFYVSYKLPLAMIYEHASKKVTISLIKRRNLEASEDQNDYIRSIEPDSRHEGLYNISREHSLYLEDVFSLNT